jgi:ubiquinone/menaquinone biosynthesis C-methylase UbiE
MYEYAISADKVLTCTTVYLELLQTMAGITGPIGKIPGNTTVLDLGCGTGNLSRLLAEPQHGRKVFAIDKHVGILSLLTNKCQRLLSDGRKPGIVPLRQDVASLHALRDELADFALMVNVLYLVNDPLTCLREILRVLKPGGEIRISGPKKDTDIGRLFRRIESDLKSKSRFEALRKDYEFVEQVNTTVLSPFLYKWNIQDVEIMLLEIGFSEIIYTTNSAYAGQAMIVCARK